MAERGTLPTTSYREVTEFYKVSDKLYLVHFTVYLDGKLAKEEHRRCNDCLPPLECEEITPYEFQQLLPRAELLRVREFRDAWY